MHPILIQINLEQVLRRHSEGDCKITPPLPVETLEFMVMSLAKVNKTSAPRVVTDDRLNKAIRELVWIWTEVWPLVNGLNSRDVVRERFKKLPDLIETLAATQPEEK